MNSLARRNASLAEEIAWKYGIKVCWVTKNTDVKYVFRGPKSHGCDTEKRVVYFIDDPDREWNAAPEAFLHEVVHIIVQCPWGARWSIDNTPEDFLLLQVERELARAFYPEKDLKRVIRWQRETLVFMHGHDELCSDPRYYMTKPWKYGYQVARILGLLDAQNRPTLRRPDWRTLLPFRDELEKYFHGFDDNSYPQLE